MEEKYLPQNPQDLDNYIVDLKDNEYRVYLSGDIEEDISKYSKFIELLHDEKNKIYIVMKTLGGNFHTALALHDTIKKGKAKTIVDVFVARSAGSLIMLACDSIKYSPHCSVMIHEPQMTYNKKRLSQCIEYFSHNHFLWEKCLDIYEGFDKDIRKILNKGNEMFYTYEDIMELKK